MEWTLWALWEDGYTDPWLLLTDLPPEASDAAWYGLRAWIEQGFKITKRAGWPWHRTRMQDPERAARLWLAVAVATLWWLSVGGAADETIPASTLLDVTALCPGRSRTRRATRLRLVSVLRQGWVEPLVALLRQEPLPQGRFVPEPWPAVPAWRTRPCACHAPAGGGLRNRRTAAKVSWKQTSAFSTPYEKTSPCKPGPPGRHHRRSHA